MQSLGGTGALMLGAALIKKAGFGGGVIFVPDPTWGNHHQIFEEHGFKVESYPYYRSDTRRADSKAAKAFFEGLCQNSVVLLHTVCHNPTGADFSMKEWRDIAEIFRERRLVPFFDFAYQGFKEGIEADREPMKLFIENGCYVLIASSFSKNASLYSKRTGALTVVAGSEGEASKVEGALKRVARTRYSNPPSDGALIVREILRSDELRKLWEEEVSQMRERIKETRRRFALELKKLGLDGSFVTDQHGIFSYTPLTPSEVQELEERGVFMLPSGRISIAGLNIRNIPTVAKHIAEVSKGWPKI
ncbi:MAG: aminotransferase class I/II-fold pyridoxal phosphate-dependent enzyme [Candidatus Dadabacteria bacterium]|nr:MAG: aminotransferase class I/II-fold pyridoxal phosphate-dependent enzyme [Candidatus Dadabacteria bacterium]